MTTRTETRVIVKGLGLYLIGLLMGVADLIPGISGGTIAFLCGIYAELLVSIRSLQLHDLKKVQWSFLLPLGGGIATALILFSKLVYFLLLHYQAPLFALFFGLIAGTSFNLARKIDFKKPEYVVGMGMGAILCFALSMLTPSLYFGSSFFGLVLAGAMASSAMLLPGISGSFLLHVIGVYPLVLYALSSPSAPGALTILLSVGLGIAFGFLVFSRVIGFFLTLCPTFMLSVLIGCTLGGMKTLWPFGQASLFLPLFLIFLGFFCSIFLEMKMKKNK